MSETEKAQMAEIRAARGRVKASLTRLENTFDEINTRNEISIRLSRLDDLFKEFERLDSNLSLEESELQEFEERYFYLNAKFNDKLDELNVQNQGRTQNSVASSITSNSNVSNFRLPKLSIPQFNGHFKDWINFKDLFVSTVHSQVSISNVEKFQYLKGLLTNEPASLIKHMPISNDSYEEAWQKLLDRYRATTSKQLMGDLQTHRVTPGRPFSVCGVDYAGPINILRYRDLVSDLTSEAFIAFPLKRFVLEEEHLSTFIVIMVPLCYARRKLQEIFKFASKLNEMNTFAIFISSEYRVAFSPPVSPHFGGLWEAGVKSIKYHLKRVIGKHKFNPFEEFSTLLTQVEVLETHDPSLFDCDNDPDSLNILTPFLIFS
ncbi:fatty acyl-CoA reductase wat [Trichonephila clavipes]|nr:fatty acyl-CoA reductase wat [Trichonephila clavipes]